MLILVKIDNASETDILVRAQIVEFIKHLLILQRELHQSSSLFTAACVCFCFFREDKDDFHGERCHGIVQTTDCEQHGSGGSPAAAR